MPDPHDTPADRPPSWQQRLLLLALNGGLFQLLYSACHLAAARAGVTRDIATAWDAQLPWLPWMLLPYMSSVPLLVLAFMRAPSGRALRALSQRCLLATALATLVFALWPLRVQPAPLPPAPWLAGLAQLLKTLDAPYNQWPSLHVAYCVILWPALTTIWPGRAARLLMGVWLLLVAVSTVFTRQHYLLDLPGGAALGAGVVWALPTRRPELAVALHYGVAALAAFTLGWTLGVPQLGWPAAGLAAWLILSCAAVAVSYARRDQNFLHKREGVFPLWVWLLYGPYLGGYALTWQLVRWRERRQPPGVPVAPGVWAGRRLHPREVAALPPHCVIIDLAAELPQTAGLGGHRVHSFPLLDLLPPSPEQLQGILACIQAERAQGRQVYVHCAMGYLRSRAVARAWCEQADLQPPPVPPSTPAPVRLSESP